MAVAAGTGIATGIRGATVGEIEAGIREIGVATDPETGARVGAPGVVAAMSTVIAEAETAIETGTTAEAAAEGEKGEAATTIEIIALGQRTIAGACSRCGGAAKSEGAAAAAAEMIARVRFLLALLLLRAASAGGNETRRNTHEGSVAAVGLERRSGAEAVPAVKATGKTKSVVAVVDRGWRGYQEVEAVKHGAVAAERVGAAIKTRIGIGEPAKTKKVGWARRVKSGGSAASEGESRREIRSAKEP